MTHYEMLRRAARAAGYTVEYDSGSRRWHIEDRAGAHPDTWPRWNPLADDGDALRLGVKLDMRIDIGLRAAIVRIYDAEISVREEIAEDGPYAATRRAIVRAAARLTDGRARLIAVI